MNKSLNVEEKLANTLDDVLVELEDEKDRYVQNPGKDFTRNRKLPFPTVMKIVLSMEGNSLKKEFTDFVCHNPREFNVSSQAFVMQRKKIKHEAFYDAFLKFNDRTAFLDARDIDGYRLLAVDGSDLAIETNLNSDTLVTTVSKGKVYKYNQFHINALYDVLNNTYLDAVVQPRPKCNEQEAAKEMVRRISTKTPSIIMADRGYLSFDLFATIEQEGFEYLFRIQNSKIKELKEIPEATLFDMDVNTVILTRLTNENKRLLDSDKKYRWLSSPSSKGKKNKRSSWTFGDHYEMNFRLVRFQLSESTYETIITSLPREQFPSDRLKELYHLRWGIETSFRHLKYTVELYHRHSKIEENIKQEIYARMLMYNFCARIANEAVVETKEETKYVYKINFTQAVHLCFDYMKRRHRKESLEVPLVEKILRHIEPVRPGRHDERRLVVKEAAFFIYRAA